MNWDTSGKRNWVKWMGERFLINRRIQDEKVRKFFQNLYNIVVQKQFIAHMCCWVVSRVHYYFGTGSLENWSRGESGKCKNGKATSKDEVAGRP